MNVNTNKVHGDIKTTEDYDQFKIIESNRKLNENHLIKLAKSIAIIGTNLQPILIDKYKNVVDGQHRLAACEIAKVPVSFVEIACLLTLEKTMIELNINSKNWGTNDYLVHGMHSKDPSIVRAYSIIYKLCLDSNLSVSTTAILTLCGSTKKRIENTNPVEVPYNLYELVETVHKVKDIYKKRTQSGIAENKVAEAIYNLEQDLKMQIDQGDTHTPNLWSYSEALKNMHKVLHEDGISSSVGKIKGLFKDSFNYKKHAKNKVSFT